MKRTIWTAAALALALVTSACVDDVGSRQNALEYTSYESVHTLPRCSGAYGADSMLLGVTDVSGLYAIQFEGNILCWTDVSGAKELGFEEFLDPEEQPADDGEKGEEPTEGTPLPAGKPAEGTPLPAKGHDTDLDGTTPPP